MNKKRSVNVLLLITILLFVVMYMAGIVIYGSKGFTHFQTFLNILINNAGLICVTCGMTCVMLTGGIDISVGSLVAMDCMIIAVGVTRWMWPAWALILFILAVGVLFGLVQGFCIAYLEIQPFIITMAGMFFARGMTAVLDVHQISVTDETFTKLSSLKITLPFGGYTNPKGMYVAPFIRISVIIALIVVLLTGFMLRKTRFGRSLYAVGGNPEAAAVSGISVFAVTLGAFMLAGVLYGFGAWLECNRMVGSGSAAYGQGWDMDAIAACVVGGVSFTGGIGKISGVVVGVLIFTALTYSLTILGIDTNLQFVFEGIIILAAVTLDCLKYVQKK